MFPETYPEVLKNVSFNINENIGILNNYRNGLVRKNYKNDEYDFFKFELIMKKISIDIIKNNGKKFDTLYFVDIKDSFVSRDKIIESIWEWTGNDVNDNTVTVYMKRIREKLGSDIIVTIKGLGYRVDE